MDQSVYTLYSKVLQKKYGGKVYKLPVSLPVSCPNREFGVGCSFCGDKGAGFENLSSTFSVNDMLQRNMEYIGKRYKADKFIAYFQSFTNTYLPLEIFKKHFMMQFYLILWRLPFLQDLIVFIRNI